jgi:hypothetical protein
MGSFIIFEHPVALIHSPPSLMQLKTVHNLSLILSNIKITQIATCFSITWPSSGNCSLFENCHAALDLKSVYFTLKCVCLRIKLDIYVVTSWVYVPFMGIRPASENTYDGGTNMDTEKGK